MSARALGILAMLLASAIWGVSPLYFHALNAVPPFELIAHRVLWSLALFAAVLAAQGRAGEILTALRAGGWRVAGAAVAILANWTLFIWAVQRGQVLQASLGYYIFPLVAVLVGVVAFGERLTLLQRWAVGLAAAAVALLTFGLGVAPWLSLAIAGSFAVYGALKKGLAMAPAASVAAEALLLAPAALVWLLAAPEAGSPVFGRDPAATALLVGSGAVTAVPLMLMSLAAQRIELALVGLLQYVNPSLQLVCAALVLGEAVTGWHLLALALIWTALGLLSAGALAGRRGHAMRDADPRGP